MIAEIPGWLAVPGVIVATVLGACFMGLIFRGLR